MHSLRHADVLRFLFQELHDAALLAIPQELRHFDSVFPSAILHDRNEQDYC